MNRVMKKRMGSIFLILTFLASCSKSSNTGQQSNCGPPDIGDRPSWVSSPPACDSQFCYFLGTSEENLASERLARESAQNEALLNLLKDQGIESAFENEIFKKATIFSTSRAASPVSNWEQYQLQQVKKLVKASAFKKWYPEVLQSCEYGRRGETFFKGFTLLQIPKEDFNFLEQWRRNQVVHRLIEESKRLKASQKHKKAKKPLQNAIEELEAFSTGYNQRWLDEIKRISRGTDDSGKECDLTGCPNPPENVFKDRPHHKYWISDKGEKIRIKVYISKNTGMRLTIDDFVPVTIRYYDDLTESMESYSYRIQKQMISRGNLGIEGRRADILTRTTYVEADNYCVQLGEKLFGESMQVAQLYQFEHALRQQKIFRDPRIRREMIVIPDDDPESGQVILTDDNFPFRFSYIKMLLFNWRTLTYSTALQTEKGDFGFRCMKEEEIGEEDAS